MAENNNNIERETVWPSDDGFAIDSSHYIPDDKLSAKEAEEIDNEINEAMSSSYEEGDLGPSHDDAEYGLDDGELDEINESFEANEDLAYDDIITIPKGTVLMRYSDAHSNDKTDTGRFLTDPGTSKEQLALDPSKEYTAHYYKVESDIDVHAGTARSWFGEEGGGVQYKLTGDERINTLQGIDENGISDETNDAKISECNENGEPIERKQPDNTNPDNAEKAKTPFYEKEGFQKGVVCITTIAGLLGSFSNAKDRPNSVDPNNAFNERPNISITIDNNNFISMDDMLEDMGFSLENQESDNKEYTYLDALIDVGQTIEEVGKDEGNLYEYVKNENSHEDDEALDILSDELESLYGDNPPEDIEESTTIDTPDIPDVVDTDESIR